MTLTSSFITTIMGVEPAITPTVTSTLEETYHSEGIIRRVLTDMNVDSLKVSSN